MSVWSVARCAIRDHIKTIHDRRTKANTKIKTVDKKIVTGAVPAFALIDELHLLGKDSNAEAIIGQLKGGMVTVPGAFWAMITTQSFDPPAGVFKSELKIAAPFGTARRPASTPCRCRTNSVSSNNGTRSSGRIPHSGIGCSRMSAGRCGSRRLRRTTLPSRSRISARFVSGRRNISTSKSASRFMTTAGRAPTIGEAAAEPELTLEELLRRCDVVVMGGDGGGLDDLLGLAVLGREKGTRRWLLWCLGWCYAKVLERRKEIGPRLRDFESRGELTIVEALGDDMKAVTDIARQVRASGKTPCKNAVGVDPAGLGSLVDALVLAGFTTEQIVDVYRARSSGPSGRSPMGAWCMPTRRL